MVNYKKLPQSLTTSTSQSHSEFVLDRVLPEIPPDDEEDAFLEPRTKATLEDKLPFFMSV